MPVYGKVIVIRRNGSDGSQFPITNETCVFGRSHDCDIRVQLPYVSNEQCKIDLTEDGEFILHNVSQSNHTIVNDKVVKKSVKLTNKDVITIIDRSFRFEYPENTRFANVRNKSLAEAIQKTPLGEQQTPSELDSPFGKLVKDMKTMIKSRTPRKRSIAKEKEHENWSETRKETPKTTPRRTSLVSNLNKMNPDGLASVPDDNKSTPTPQKQKADVGSKSRDSSRSSLSVAMLNADDILNELSDPPDLHPDEKENVENKKGVRRPKARRSADSAKKRKSKDAVVLPTSTSSVGSADDGENEVSIRQLPSDDEGNVEPHSELAVEEQGRKKRRSSRRRSSLQAHPTVTNPKLSESFKSAPVSDGYSLQSVSSSSLNSSEATDELNQGMISEGCLDVSNGSSNKSKLQVNTSKTSDVNSSSPLLVKGKKQTKPFIAKSPNSPKISADDTPKISLTTTAPAESYEDPYNFPEENDEKTKKYRRRSSGSSTLSRKQTLLLFGSPRHKEVTPLRRSIGRLRRTSEPLVEDAAEVASPEIPAKKIWEPLPEVTEVENNSSPIKKPRKPLKHASTPPASTRRKLGRVSFGPDLSPEQFLKELPPNTPVRKGATPAKGATRKSVVTLSTVEETTDQTFKSPLASARAYQKVTRTPTPFKADVKKFQSKSLLQQVLHASVSADLKSAEGASPKLSRKRKSSEKMEKLELKQDKLRKLAGVEDSPIIKPSGSEKAKQRSKENPPVKGVHKTTANLRRRSFGKAAKPLWSEIVKKPAQKAAPTKPTVKAAVLKVAKQRKVVKKKRTPVSKQRHVDSPATIYIGRSRNRIKPAKTPRPSKLLAAVKLDVPLDEDFSGLPELFATPSKEIEQDDLYDDLKTPMSVGEMIVSPMTAAAGEGNNQSGFNKGLGASPELRKTPNPGLNSELKSKSGSDASRRRMSPRFSLSSCDTDFDRDVDKSTESFLNTSEGFKNNGVNEQFGTKRIVKTSKASKEKEVKDHFGTKRIFKTPKAPKEKEVKEHFGTKRLLKTPKSPKGKELKDHFGTKRLLKTPKAPKGKEVEEHFGTKRLLKTPKSPKGKEVEEHFGTKRLLKTPKDRKASSVEDKFGTKRIFKTPRGQKLNSVEENLGIASLFKTPREKKSAPVDDHFGTKRLFQSPRPEKGKEVEDKAGTKRLFRTPKEEKSKAVENHFGTKRIFKSPKEKRNQSVRSNFGLRRIFHSKEAKSAGVSPDSEDLHLSLLYPAEASDQSSESEIADSTSIAMATKSETRSSRRNQAANSVILASQLKGTRLTKSAAPPKSSRAVVQYNVSPDRSGGESDGAKSVLSSTRRGRKKTSSKTSSSEASFNDDLNVVEASSEKRQVTFHSLVSFNSGSDAPINDYEPEEPSPKKRRKNAVQAAKTKEPLKPNTKRSTRKQVNPDVPKDTTCQADLKREETQLKLRLSRKRRAEKYVEEEAQVLSDEKPEEMAVTKATPRRGRSKALGSKKEVINVEEEIPVTKPTLKRGRSKALTSNKEVVNVEEEIPFTKPTPKRGRSKAPTSNKEVVNVEEEIPITKPTPKRGRSKTLNSNKEVVNVEEEIPVTKPTPKRGRSKALTSNKEVVNVEEEIPFTKPTPKRGRSKALTSNKEVVNVEEEIPFTKPTPKRGRSKALTSNKEVVNVEEEIPFTKPTPKRGRSKALTSNKEVVNVEEEIPFTKPTPKRGRSKALTSNKEVVNVEEEIPFTKPTPKRGRSKALTSNKEVVNVEEEILFTKPTPKRGRSKALTSNKEVVNVEEEIPFTKPTPKRGRSKALTSNKEVVNVEEEIPFTKPTPKRGRSKALTSNKEVVNVEEEIPFTKPTPKRGRSKALTSNKEVVNVEEEIPFTKPTPKRGRSKALTSNKEVVNVEEEIPFTKPTPKRGRSKALGSKKEVVDLEEEMPFTKPTPKRGRSKVVNIVEEIPVTRATPRKGRSKGGAGFKKEAENATFVEPGKTIDGVGGDPTPVVPTPRKGRSRAAPQSKEVRTVLPVLKSTRRGRKQAAKDEDFSDAKAESVPAPKATRKGRSKAASPRKEIKDASLVVESKAAEQPKLTRGKRGRTALNQAAEVHKAVEEEANRAPARRGRSKISAELKQDSVKLSESKEKPKRKTNKKMEDSTTDKPTPRKGRSRILTKLEVQDNSEKEVNDKAKPTSKPPAKKRAKTTSEKDEGYTTDELVNASTVGRSSRKRGERVKTGPVVPDKVSEPVRRSSRRK